MPRPQSPLKALATRKELLVAEARVLRTLLNNDLAVVHEGIAAWGAQTRSFASYASVAAAVLGGFSEFRRRRRAEFQRRPSFFSTFLTGVQTASAVWSTLRSRQS